MEAEVEVRSECLRFSELSETAKDKARESVRYDEVSHCEWWDYTYDDAVRLLGIMGVEVEAKDIGFSGFASQGDGASFAGRYRPTGGGCSGKIKAEASQDETLHALAGRLDALQVACALKYNDLWRCDIVKRASYYRHSGCMNVSTIDFCSDLLSTDDVPDDDYAQLEDELEAIFRGLADWIYSNLEDEHDHLISDEAIDERLDTDEQLYDEDGSRI